MPTFYSFCFYFFAVSRFSSFLTPTFFRIFHFAKMASANFSFHWKIKWPEFDDLPTNDVVHRFITAHKNVAFHWRTELSTKKEGTPAHSFAFHFVYEDGPASEMKNVGFNVKLLQTGGRYVDIFNDASSSVSRGAPLFVVHKNLTNFKVAHNLPDGLFYFLITISIPAQAFLALENNFLDPRPAWVSDVFKCVDDQ